VRRGDIDQLRGQVLLREQFDTQTVPPHADRDQLHPGSLQSGTNANVARIFDDGNIARISENASRKVNCLLGPVDNNDLVSMTAQASRPSNISRNRLTQSWKAGRLTVDRDLSGRLSAMASKEPAPQVQR